MTLSNHSGSLKISFAVLVFMACGAEKVLYAKGLFCPYRVTLQQRLNKRAGFQYRSVYIIALKLDSHVSITFDFSDLPRMA